MYRNPRMVDLNLRVLDALSQAIKHQAMVHHAESFSGQNLGASNTINVVLGSVGNAHDTRRAPSRAHYWQHDPGTVGQITVDAG